MRVPEYVRAVLRTPQRPPRRMASSVLCAAIALVVLVGTQRLVFAHPLEPVIVELRETVPTRWEVSWRKSSGTAVPPVSIELPDGCSPRHVVGPRQSMVRCPTASMANGWLVLAPSPATEDVWVRVRFADGVELSGLLPPREKRFHIARFEMLPRTALLAHYSQLGIAHVLEGIDHLLFLAAMVGLIASWRRMLLTVTSFTLGHTLALCVASGSWLRVPQEPTEILIAGSIVLVARELWNDARTTSNASAWYFAAFFGFLHGLGFAGALSEFGIPDRAFFWALAGFNVGVEFGQLGWVLLLFSGKHAVERSAAAAFVRQCVAAGVGVAGAALVLQRLAPVSRLLIPFP